MTEQEVREEIKRLAKSIGYMVAFVKIPTMEDIAEDARMLREKKEAERNLRWY